MAITMYESAMVFNEIMMYWYGRYLNPVLVCTNKRNGETK